MTASYRESPCFCKQGTGACTPATVLGWNPKVLRLKAEEHPKKGSHFGFFVYGRKSGRINHTIADANLGENIFG